MSQQVSQQYACAWSFFCSVLPFHPSVYLSQLRRHARWIRRLQCVACRSTRTVALPPLLGHVGWHAVRCDHCHASYTDPSLPAISMLELGPNFTAPSQRRTLITAFSLQFAPKNLLVSSAEHLPIIPSRHFSPRTPRPALTNTAQMGGFSHSQCHPGVLNDSQSLIDKRPLTRAC